MPRKSDLSIPLTNEGFPPAEIEIRYQRDDTFYRLDAKGIFEVKPKEPEDDLPVFGIASAWEKVVLEPTKYELKGRLIPDKETGTAFTITTLGTRKRVQLKKGVPLDIQSILSAQESVRAPAWAKITTGKDWVEFFWTPAEPKEKKVK